MSFLGTYKLQIGISNSKKKKSFETCLLDVFIYAAVLPQPWRYN